MTEKRKRAPADPAKKTVILQNVDRALFDRALNKCQLTRVNGRPLALTRVIEALVRDWVNRETTPTAHPDEIVAHVISGREQHDW